MTYTKNKSRQVLVHSLCWIAFLAFPLIFSPPPMKNNLFFDSPLPGIFLFNVLLIVFFYFSYQFSVVKFYFEKKYVYFIITTLIGIILVTTLPHFIFRMPFDSAMLHRPKFVFFRTQDVFMTLLALFMAVLLRSNERIKKIETEKISAELASLKAQINPHFLFNTLNSIYSQTLGKADKASSMLLKLSEMMRYAVPKTTLDKVEISQELRYINNYIELQKVRLSDKIKLEHTIDTKENENQISPFLLIPFIENAFKYGVNSEQFSHIKINLNIINNVLSLIVYNLKVPVEMNDDEKSGLGILSTQKRLALLYPARHQLEIKDTRENFTVSLRIDLK
jgi:sensor histidine kinase YesM